MRMTTTPPLAPAISVAMPMYNVEKYIGACLESILKQTFQDFEVVVVDNGSTDNSPAILESYIPKFGGRLKTFRIEKNSGSPSPAYNKAVALSRGKYAFVMDSDDLLIKNALEILYNYAEKSNADVVYTSGFYDFHCKDKNFPNEGDIGIARRDNLIKPTFESEDIGERINKICNRKVFLNSWQRLVIRDLLIENNIIFQEGAVLLYDNLWALQVNYHAKKILTIPELLYVYRVVSDSISHEKRTLEKNAPLSMKSMFVVMNAMEKFLNSQKFFQENPQYSWKLLHYFESISFEAMISQTLGNQQHELLKEDKFYNLIRKEFSTNFDNYGGLMAYFGTAANVSHWKEKFLIQRIAVLENKLKQLQGG